MEVEKTTLILCDKRWRDAKGIFLILAVMIAIILFVLLFATIAVFPEVPWQRLAAKLAEKFSLVDWSQAFVRHLDAVVIFGTVVLQMYYMSRAKKLERLVLSYDGVRYLSPLPPFLKRFKPDWYLAWDQVGKAELITIASRMNNPEFVQLTLNSASGKRRIFPMHWVDPEKYASPVFRFKFTLSSMRLSRDEMLKSVMESEVVRFISGNVPGITIDSTLNDAEIYTSLEKNPHGQIAMGMVFLLLAYAILDFFAGPDAYVDAPLSQLHIYLTTVIAVAILTGLWLYRSVLNPGEKFGMAILIGTLAGFAMIPGALRINAFPGFGTEGTYDYFVVQGTDGVVLKPVVAGMPSIDYFAKKSFWAKFGKDDTYPVHLHKGILGFYQFRLSPILDEIRGYEGK